MLNSDLGDWLPPIKILTSAPVFIDKQGELKVLKKGYHNVCGGIYVLKNRDIREVSQEQAKNDLLGLLDDFNFVSAADKSRAIASLLSPALRFGGLLGEVDFPVDVAEADQSQSGKTYRQRIVCKLYGEEPFIISLKEKDGGVGSVDEALSEGVLSGRPFLMLENVRGKVASQLLESAVRGVGHVHARRAYSRGVQTPTDHIYWMLTSNAAETTLDLANRSVMTRVRKQPRNYPFKRYPEGDLLAHVRANTDRYLSAIFTVLGEWYRRGKPCTDEFRHDFREWCQALDWFVRNIFSGAPLMDGHREEQDRISNPELGWLRRVALAAEKDDRLVDALKPAEIVEICENHGIDVPGCRINMDDKQVLMQAGKVLKRIFRENATVMAGGFEITRETLREYSPERRRETDVHYHRFSKSKQ